MKARVSIIALVMTVMVLWSNVSQAQSYQSAAGVNVGASLISMLFRAINYADDPGWKSTQIPTIQGVYDYRISERFSVGGAASFSNISVDYSNDQLTNTLDGELQNFKFGLTRINVAARGLVYYTSSDVFELYSGLRLGVNIWNLNVESTDPDFAAGVDPLAEASNFARAASPGAQVIALGANIYPTENIGINFEFAIGQPYFAAIGLRYRF